MESKGKGKFLWVKKLDESIGNIEGGSTFTMDAIPSFGN